MNMFFNMIGKQLYDLVGDSESNTVGNVAKGFASGGIVGDESSTTLNDNNPLGINSIIRQEGNALSKGLSGAVDTYGKSFRDQLTLGHFIHNNFGNFFRGADPGGTNSSMKPPSQGKVSPATDPNDFYSRW